MVLLCDSCNREADHFFLRVKDDEEYWVCCRCVDLERDILEVLEGNCLNAAEICRIFNGVESPEDCYKGQEFGAIRGWRKSMCRSKENNCTFHYCNIYSLLRRLERNGKIRSVKTRFWDKTPLRTDLFRFWFRDYRTFESRVSRQKLDGYIH